MNTNQRSTNVHNLPMLPVKSYSSRYQNVAALGSGSFGSVKLAKMQPHLLENMLNDMKQCQGTLLYPVSISYRAPTNLVAIKTMTRQLKKLQDYSKVKEVHFILSVKSHFNLVQVMDIFIDKASLKLNIVMETMDQNLYQLMKSRKNIVFSPRTLKSILTQLLAAILHIHRHLFFHRDVKPENILIMHAQTFYGSKSNIPQSQRDHAYIVKLADYGLARHIQNHKPYTAYVSTRWYRSPEILLRQNSYSFPVDIWAFGCVAVECATFIPLFPGSNELDQTDKVVQFLGSPQKLSNGKQSFGGIWEDALLLAKHLQIKVNTDFRGSNLENVIFRNDFSSFEKNDLFDIIKGCLTWDPYKRITAVTLCHMNYFKNTIVDTRVQKENVNISLAQKNHTFSDNKYESSNYYNGNKLEDNSSENKFSKSQLMVNLSPSKPSLPSLNDSPFNNAISKTASINITYPLPIANLSNLRKSAFLNPGLLDDTRNTPKLTLNEDDDFESENDNDIVSIDLCENLDLEHDTKRKLPKGITKCKMNEPVIKHLNLIDEISYGLDDELDFSNQTAYYQQNSQHQLQYTYH